MCPQCPRVFPADSSAPRFCSACNAALFDEESHRHLSRDVPSEQNQPTKPKLQCPQRLLSTSLPAFLNRPGIEDVLDEWRQNVPAPQKLKTVMDGNIWKTIRGNDGNLFFDNSPDWPDPDELRIGITLGFDGYVCQLDWIIAYTDMFT
jgi:hypothetical protein